MSSLKSLSPSSLWGMFDQICSIPHPSHHEEHLADFIIKLAQKHNIECNRDDVGNILLRKSASLGKEDVPSLALQAHLDMVPQKNDETDHDFIKDPIMPYVDGDWVKAKGTTLGADNGIGLASILAIFCDDNLSHGPIEALLTMTEETGMIGAFGLKPNWLKSNLLINTDSESEGEVYIGCAGGINVNMDFSLTRKIATTEHKAYQLIFKGLKGGHSGCDIHLGLANANKIVARFLSTYADSLKLEVCEVNGGTLRNAIPREASITFAIPEEKTTFLQDACNEFLQLLLKEYSDLEPNLVLVLSPLSSLPYNPLEIQCQNTFINWLSSLPNGVMRMSSHYPNIVETSLNIGVISTKSDDIEVTCLIRSLVDSQRDYTCQILQAQCALASVKIDCSGSYPGWNPDLNSTLTHFVTSKYKELFNSEPQKKLIHAGLECGLFKAPYPEMDMVSIGPTIKGAHSPDERVKISSVEKYWKLLTTLVTSASEMK